MDLREFLLESFRTVFKEQMPGLLNTALKQYLDSNPNRTVNSKHDDIIRIDRLEKLTGYARPTIYAKVSRGEMPCLGRGRPLLFSEQQINLWILADRPKVSDIEEIKHLFEIKIKTSAKNRTLVK